MDNSRNAHMVIG